MPGYMPGLAIIDPPAAPRGKGGACETVLRDRSPGIGVGPWHNAAGTLVANNVAELHARTGDASLFVDERGQRINGQWSGSPSPVEHDMLTGSNADGTLLPGMTCADWTSAATE